MLIELSENNGVFRLYPSELPASPDVPVLAIDALAGDHT
jgi:hypothetical protein